MGCPIAARLSTWGCSNGVPAGSGTPSAASAVPDATGCGVGGVAWVASPPSRREDAPSAARAAASPAPRPRGCPRRAGAARAAPARGAPHGGAALNELSENFKTRHAPPVGAYALFFALSKCDHLSLYGIPSPDSNRLERQPYWPRKTKTDGKPTKIDIFGDRVFYGLVRLFALEGFLDVVN